MKRARRARRRVLLALTLGCIVPVAKSDAAAEDGLRLAATLATGSERVALVALGDTQRWLRPGDDAGECVLRRVEPSQAEFDCQGAAQVLALSAGKPGAPARKPRVISAELQGRELLEALSNPQGFTLGLDLVPEGTGPTPDGWRIRHLATGHALHRLGLREGDLVTTVGGIPAGDPHALAKFLGQVPELGAFTVELLRAGDALVLQLRPGTLPN